MLSAAVAAVHTAVGAYSTSKALQQQSTTVTGYTDVAIEFELLKLYVLVLFRTVPRRYFAGG
jgi:hypothetical protein